MPNQIGLGSGWSLAKETTYGTLATPTRALPFISEGLKLDRKTIDSLTLKGGNYLPTSDSWRHSVRAAAGQVQTLLYGSGAGLLWQAMLGGVTTTGAGPYTHTFAVTKAVPSYSMDVTIGEIGASAYRKTLLGAKVDAWEVALATEQNATLGLDWIAQDLVAAIGALRGSYPANQKAYNFADGAVSGAGLPAGVIQSIKLRGNNNLKKDLYGLGFTTLREPERNGRMQITGEMEVTVDGTLTNWNLWANAAELALVLTLTLGSNVLTITMNVRVDEYNPAVAGEQMQMTTIPFTVIAASTDALAFQVVLQNADSAP